MRVVICLVLFLFMLRVYAAEMPGTFDDKTGVWRMMVESPHQGEASPVELLLPSDLDASKRYPVVFILPVVGAKGQGSFGDGLQEARKADVANKFQVICVCPYMHLIPWYGNHHSDADKQQERYMLESLIPFIDQHYPTDPKQRKLIGFSKSGWGALTMIMRHPQVFQAAAIWDAPLMINGKAKDWGPMGLKKVYGKPEAMLPNIPRALIETHAKPLLKEQRLVLGLGNFWRKHMQPFHELLKAQKIPHVFRTDLTQKHRWDTGWFVPMFEELMKLPATP